MSQISLLELKQYLNNSSPLINSIISKSKDEFSEDEVSINIAIGFLSELKEILFCINMDHYVFNRNLADSISILKNYSFNLLSKYKVPNSYKLYDCLKIDVINLKNFLNSVN